jgi:hypothetical protein
MFTVGAEVTLMLPESVPTSLVFDISPEQSGYVSGATKRTEPRAFSFFELSQNTPLEIY